MAAEQDDAPGRAEPGLGDALKRLLESARAILLAFALALLLRAFVFEPVHVPTTSMTPTLLSGDTLLVAKWPYGFGSTSVPFLELPFLEALAPRGGPSRGDVVVFRNALRGGDHFVKRVVGLPGDTIQMRAGVLHINGEAAPREPAGEYLSQDETGATVLVRAFRETLPNGVCHQTRHYEYIAQEPPWRAARSDPDDTIIFQVPPGHVFVMGDNRDASADSRQPERVGYVPIADIIGRADWVVVSATSGFRWRDPRTWLNLRWGRFFHAVRSTR